MVVYIRPVDRRFAVKIQTLRKARGFSQEALAKRAGRSQSWLCVIETGARRVSLENVERLAVALDTTPEELLEGVFFNG